MKCLLLAVFLVGCGGESFTGSGLIGIVDPVGDGGVALGAGGGAGGETEVGAGGAPAAGGAVHSGGAASEGAPEIGAGGTETVGTGGAGRGGEIGAGGVAPVCLTDLSGVGAGDFSIHFTLTTTETVLTLGLMNQRTGCDDMSTFWDISLSPTGGIIAATNDGTHLVVVEAGNSLNDGKPHKVDVIRRGGLLWYASDGVIHSVQTPDPYSFGTFPPLVLGSSACAGTTPALDHAAISEVCISEP